MDKECLSDDVDQHGRRIPFDPTIKTGGEDLSVFEIMQRYRNDGSCEYVIEDALRRAALLDSDSQAAGDAQRLAFAIESAAVKAGIIEARQHSLTGPQLLMLCDDLAAASTNAATRMRDKCVETVRAIGNEVLAEVAAVKPDGSSFSVLKREAVIRLLRRLIPEIESLTLDQEQEAKQS